MRDVFREPGLESERRSQSVENKEMRKPDELQDNKNPIMDTEPARIVEQQENEESIKMGAVSRIREGKESRRIEKRDLGVKSSQGGSRVQMGS